MKKGGSAKRSEFTMAAASGTACFFVTLVANKLIASAFSARLTHNLNRKFVQADDARKGSEETATAFTVSKTIAITREQSFNLQIHKSTSKITVTAETHTQTRSALPYIHVPPVATPQGTMRVHMYLLRCTIRHCTL